MTNGEENTHIFLYPTPVFAPGRVAVGLVSFDSLHQQVKTPSYFSILYHPGYQASQFDAE